MDMDYFGRLFLSIVVFAPGLILLTVLVFVGLLMAAERLGLFGQAAKKAVMKPTRMVEASNPAPGSVVDGVTDAILADSTEDAETGSPRASEQTRKTG